MTNIQIQKESKLSIFEQKVILQNSVFKCYYRKISSIIKQLESLIKFKKPTGFSLANCRNSKDECIYPLYAFCNTFRNYGFKKDFLQVRQYLLFYLMLFNFKSFD